MYDAVFITDQEDVLDVSMITLGPYKCAHELRKLGYKCLVVTNTSAFTQEDFKELFFYAIGPNTKFVGFSTTFLWISNDGVLNGDKTREDQVVSEIKKLNKDTKIVIGGAKAHKEFANTNVDFVVVGYGETSVVNIMNHLDNNQQLTDSFVNIHGVTIVDNQHSETYKFVSDVMHWLPEDIVNYTTLPIEMARGCIFKCKFCFHRDIGKKKLEYVKQYDALKQELHQVYNDFGITHYLITDDTFNDDVSKLEQIRRVTDTLPEQLKCWSYMRVDLLGRFPEMVPILKDIGVRATIFGIESMHPKASALIGKGGSRQKIIDTLHMLKSDFSELSTHSGFIAGLPYEPISSLERTHNDLMSGKIQLDSWNWIAFGIQKPGLYQSDSYFNLNYEKYGYENQGYVYWDRITDNQVPNNILVNWKNAEWDFEQCWQWATEADRKAIESGRYYLDGLFALGTHTFPTPELDFDILRRKLIGDVNFSLIKRAKEQFIKDYKTKLFKLIRT